MLFLFKSAIRVDPVRLLSLPVINILQVLRFPTLFGDYSWTSYRLSLINRVLHNECFPKGTYITIAEYSSPERQIFVIRPKCAVRDITV